MISNSKENDWGLFVDIEHGLDRHVFISNMIIVKPNKIIKSNSIIDSMYNIISWFLKHV